MKRFTALLLNPDRRKRQFGFTLAGYEENSKSEEHESEQRSMQHIAGLSTRCFYRSVFTDSRVSSSS